MPKEENSVKSTKCFRSVAKLQKATIGFVMSACPSARNNSEPIGRIFIKVVI